MDFEEFSPFQMPINVLKMFGVWMVGNSSKAYLVYGIFMHFIIVDVYTSLMLIFMTTIRSFSDFAALMNILPTYISLFFKSINFLTKTAQIQRIMTMTRELYQECPDNSKLKKRLGYVDKVYKCYLITTVFACLAVGIVALENLPYRMWFPFETNTSGGYATAALYQFVAVSIAASITNSVDMIPVFFMCYIAGFLDALNDWLESIKSSRSGGKVDNHEELKKCLEYHMKLQEYVNLVHKTFSLPWFFQGMMSTLILCTTAFSLTLVSSYFHVWNINKYYYYFITKLSSQIRSTTFPEP